MCVCVCVFVNIWGGQIRDEWTNGMMNDVTEDIFSVMSWFLEWTLKGTRRSEKQ